MGKILCKLLGHQWRHTSTTPHHDLYTYHYECVVCKAQKTNFTQEKKRNLFLEFIITLICGVIGGLWYVSWDTTQQITIAQTAGFIIVMRYVLDWVAPRVYTWLINLIYRTES